jgi:hypothetical protein
VRLVFTGRRESGLGVNVHACPGLGAEALRTLLDPHNVLSRLVARLSETRFAQLSKVDIYGETAFNYLQIPELLSDVHSLREDHAATDEQSAFLDRLSELAQWAAAERHLLIFHGD